jgi:hypothetical protein
MIIFKAIYLPDCIARNSLLLSQLWCIHNKYFFNRFKCFYLLKILQLEIIKIEKNLPFLRWAGGKKWLIKHLDDILPKNGFNSYHEPYLRGGSVFFCLKPKCIHF